LSLDPSPADRLVFLFHRKGKAGKDTPPMEATSLVKLAIVGSIVLLVLAIGMAAPPGVLRVGFRDPSRIGRAMLAMFVVVPAFTLLVVWLLPLEPAARVALLALAVSPMPPMLPMKEQKLGGTIDYALAIQVAASVTALVAAPLFILVAGAVFGRQLSFDFVDIASTIFITIVAPLGVGIAVATFAPAFARRAAGPVRLLATILLAIGFLIVLWTAFPGIVAAAYGPTVIAVVLMTVFGLAVGHWLGGPEVGNRHALALATSARHPGVAIGLAGAAELAAGQSIVAVVLLYFLAGTILTIPYTRWAKGRV
jgi:BASS family bile acid:Na+ symporter